MYLLAVVEMCQRFAFWGVGNLLVLYLVQHHHFADASADTLYGAFTALAFILPVFGGYFADKFGYRLPILAGSYASALGCFLLATGIPSLIYAALICVALGASVFTPSIYALLGRAYEDKHHLREGGFSLYYCSVNIGIFLAMLILGLIGQNHSWGIAFTLAGIVQLFGIWPFLKVIKSPVLASMPAKETVVKKVQKEPFVLKPHEKQRLIVICVLAAFSILFWMTFNQGGSSMTLFALRYTDRNLFGFQMPPSWLLSAESLFLVILVVPLTSLYAYLARTHRDPSPPIKSAMGLFAMSLCFLVMVIGSLSIPAGAKSALISPFYLIFSYGLMALAEMLITPIGLSLVTHLSPRRYTAMMVGIWYLCIGIGFYLGGILAGKMGTVSHLSYFFGISVVILLIPAVILLFVSKKLNKMRHMDML